MPNSEVKKLSTLFRSAIKTTTRTSSAEDATLKEYVSSLNISSSSISSASKFILKQITKPSKSKSRTKNAKPSAEIPKLKLGSSSSSLDESHLSRNISTILCDKVDTSLDSQENNDGKYLESLLKIPWFSNMSNSHISLRRKELSRNRKQKWIFKSTQVHRFDRLVKMCAEKLGTDATLHVFGRLGRETGLKEYNALIALCIEEAKKSDEDEVSLQQTYRAFQLLKTMSENGFQLEDETYKPLLMYLIDMCMIDEFHFFCGVIKGENPAAVSRLGYYEMLLWIQVDNEYKIKELCSRILAENGEDMSNLRENYLLALCDCDRTQELLEMLEVVDIKNISVDYISIIFKSFGRLSLESYMEKFILTCKTCDYGAEQISHFIFNYVSTMPNLAIDEAILKFKDVHAKLEVTPSSLSYEKLVLHCCDSQKVHVALNTVDQMYEAGLNVSIDTFNSILHASEESCDFNLVHRIYSVIRRHNLKPNNETFKSMITLSVKMKDYVGAYEMIKDVKEMNLMPTANMYNAIMAGYFREKNISAGRQVLKHMELADVKPDSNTYSYLINNCEAEEDIIKYCEELKHTGIQVTKHIYMSLINAYVNFGQFEKAKQVVLDKAMSVKYANEVKSTLISALASHGKLSDALILYKEMKETGCCLDHKAILNLIEYTHSEGEVSTLLQLLKELTEPNYWADGCSRVILYCVRYKHLSPAIDLLKQLKDRYCEDEFAGESVCDEIFSQIAETEPVDVQLGLDLLRNLKEKIEFIPSRKCLDFLLGACVKAKDLNSSHLVWQEYEANGMPYNVLSYLRMYQCLLACGAHKSAIKMKKKIPKDDTHVRSIIKAYRITYAQPNSSKGKKKKHR